MQLLVAAVGCTSAQCSSSMFFDLVSCLLAPTEQIFHNLRQECSRIQRRRQLEGAFNQAEACSSSDAISPISSLNAPSSPPGQIHPSKWLCDAINSSCSSSVLNSSVMPERGKLHSVRYCGRAETSLAYCLLARLQGHCTATWKYTFQLSAWRRRLVVLRSTDLSGYLRTLAL